jgi:signal transduction histidine kinase
MNYYCNVTTLKAKCLVESDRATVAKNLHDDISMPLNVIRLNLTKLSRNKSDKLISEKLITESLHLLDESIECIRSVAKDYCPPTLMKLGYVKGISELCNQMNSSESLEVGVVINANEIRLPFPTEFEAYRITKEILNNIIKHSYSPKITISINSDEKGLSTVISHSGFGLDSKTAKELSETDKGVGIKSIQNRAEMIGGYVQYDKEGWNQYKTTIDIPNSCKN